MQKGDGLAAEQLLSLEWSEGAIRVLFVEDDDDFREALCWQLAERGFSVLGFADGDALLGALNVRSDADLVLLDWSLPSASGVELLELIARARLQLACRLSDRPFAH